MTCEVLAVVALFGLMCATFVALWLGPLYFMDRAERRLKNEQ